MSAGRRINAKEIIIQCNNVNVNVLYAENKAKKLKFVQNFITKKKIIKTNSANHFLRITKIEGLFRGIQIAQE